MVETHGVNSITGQLGLPGDSPCSCFTFTGPSDLPVIHEVMYQDSHVSDPSCLSEDPNLAGLVGTDIMSCWVFWSPPMSCGRHNLLGLGHR